MCLKLDHNKGVHVMSCDPSEVILASPHFYWSNCFVCQQGGTAANPLKRCSRCNCIYYCSVAHQREHWRQHKKLCSYLSTAAEEIGADIFFGLGAAGEEEDDPAKNWRRFRVNAVANCEILIGRKLQEWEKEMFLFPRACRRCHRAKTEGMQDCKDCLAATYCGDQCREEDAANHDAASCLELEFARVCDVFESTVSVAAPPVPAEVNEAFVGLPSDMVAFLESNKHQSPSSNVTEMEHRFLADRLSGPLTILHVAQSFGLAGGKKLQDQEELTVHVVGANIMEMLGIIKWEFISHRLPRCALLRIIFVGPELEEEEEQGECRGLGECADCCDKGKRVIYEIRCAKYDAYARSRDYRRPDMVVALNCGFHEYAEQPSLETWRDSLPFMLHHEGVPLVFTSYNMTEAEKDYQCIVETGKSLKFDVVTSINPFRSFRPIRDFEADHDRDVFYNNQFYSVVRLN